VTANLLTNLFTAMSRPARRRNMRRQRRKVVDSAQALFFNLQRRETVALRPTDAMDFLSELWLFMRVRKKYWLMPIFLMSVVFGGLLVLSKGSAVAPFIYTIF
jgi:Family of unknown function (DUF5989)